MPKKKTLFKNKRLIFLSTVLAIITVVAGAFFVLGRNTIAGEKIVVLKDTGFSPETLTIHKGETVTFKNEREVSFWPASNLHPAHDIYPEFDSKEAIAPNETWSFTFNDVGRWGYHDHLFPSFTGVIEVLEVGARARKSPTKVKDCAKISEVSEKTQCWDELLANTLKKKGLSAAFDIFVDLYETDPSIPKNCHGWGHILGKEAYNIFRDKRAVILRPESAYCGYGFYHGFMERALLDKGDINEMKTFCEYAQRELPEDGAVYPNCIHGIGHGSVNIDDASIWGNFQAMIQPGLDNCEKILTTQGDLLTCWEGAFNAMALLVNDESYGFTFDYGDQENLFATCRKQEEKYKKACYFEFIGLITAVTNHDFEKAGEILLRENLGQGLEQYLIFKMAGDFMQEDIVNPTHEENVYDCRNLPTHLYKQCFTGVISGFIGHGDPEKAYVKGLEFCEEDVLSQWEKDKCYEDIVSSTVPRNSSVCKNLPEVYQKYCLQEG